MADNQFSCPECGTTLRPKNPPAPGKKAKCPKCEAIFVPIPADGPAEQRPAATAKKAAPKRPIRDDDDDEVGQYGFDAEDAKDEERTNAARKKALDPLNDKRPRSARGPAHAIVMPPSNKLLGTATITCVSCVISIVAVLWPLVFVVEKKPDEFTDPKTIKKPLTPEEKTARQIKGAMVIGFAVLAFVYNGFIALGAVKMQSLESYTFAMAASLLILAPFNWFLAWPAFDWFIRLVISIAGDDYFWHFTLLTIATIVLWDGYVGIWSFITLRKPEVVAGFQEKKPADI